MNPQPKIGNPAVVGLAGFGLTTLLLQLHNLGYCSLGPVLVMGVMFGGLCQMIAGFQEQKVGNNFGYAAFVAYGAFWIGLCGIFVLNAAGIERFSSSGTDVGYFLLVWTGYTAILWVASMRVHGAMAITFTLLLAGFVLLDVGHFGFPTFNTIGATVLIACALMAWYMMAAALLNDLAGAVVLPLGKPWIARKPTSAPLELRPPTHAAA